METAEIIRIDQETPTVKSFRLALPAPTFSFLPGQWMDLYIEDPDEGDLIGGFSITARVGTRHSRWLRAALASRR